MLGILKSTQVLQGHNVKNFGTKRKGKTKNEKVKNENPLTHHSKFMSKGKISETHTG